MFENSGSNKMDQLQRYEKLGKIGKGTYGVVYKAKDLKTNEMVALKKMIIHVRLYFRGQND